MQAYGTWIDWEKDKIVPNGIELEAEHNQQGEKLTEKVKKKLMGNIKFVSLLQQWLDPIIHYKKCLASLIRRKLSSDLRNCLTLQNSTCIVLNNN